jgi:hypothetical protein
MLTIRNPAPLLLAGCTGLWLALQSGLTGAYPLRKAIKDFQQTQGLKADGKTSAKLVQQMNKGAGYIFWSSSIAFIWYLKNVSVTKLPPDGYAALYPSYRKRWIKQQDG